MNDLRHSFDLLRLKPGATPAELKRAFRDQVAAWHPDRFPADPDLRRRAEERLRLVIEAHRAIEAHYAARRGSRPHRPGAAGRFFRSAPNLVFCAVVLGSALLAVTRHGMTSLAWGAAVELALIPALFSLAYNLTDRSRGVVRSLYLGFSLCALAVVAVEGAMAGLARSDPAGGQEVFAPGDHDGGAAGSGWGLHPEDPAPPGGKGGGYGSSAQVPLRAPEAPLAPAAPEAPLAPAAPAAPLVPVAPPAR
uniref:J domain-containing protein n=1 Tax=Geobacter metallireducens TaxID=28232 RepID=A0A831UCL3_GEOME